MVSGTAERALRAPAPEHRAAHGGPTAYRLLPWSGLALFVAVLVAVGPAEIFPDTWFALDGARELLQHGFGDRNTWTRYGSHEWVNQQWAAHLGFYAAWRIGGAIGLATLNILLVGSGLALCMCAAMRRGGSAAWTAAVLIAVLVATNSDLWFARAQSYSVLCFGLLAWLLTRDAGRLDRQVFLAIPLIAAWTNLHAAAVVGAGICGVYALVSLVQPGPRAHPLVGRALLLATGACLACLATPFIGGMPWYLRQTMGNHDFARFLPEWHPTTLAGSPMFVIGTFVALVIVVRSPIGRLDALVLAGLTIAGFVAWRSELWAYLWWLIVLPAALERRRPARPGRLLQRAGVALAALAAVVLVLALAQDIDRGGSRFATAWPRPVARLVEQAVRTDPRLRVYADQPVADWLLYDAPAVRGRLATDGRYEVFDHRMFEDVDGLTQQPIRIGPMIADEDLYVLSPHPWGDPRLIRALERAHGIVVLYRSPEVVVLRRL